MSSPLRLTANGIFSEALPLVSGLPDGCIPVEDPTHSGIFVRFTSGKKHARHVWRLGQLPGLQRFTCVHRYEPFWMYAAAGSSVSQVPVETQFLLIDLGASAYIAIVPILDGAFRASLQGAGDGSLEVVVESGDPSVVTDGATCIYLAGGTNPYTLIESAAQSVMEFMPTGRLRQEKLVPPFVDQFGWCTWDAFYREVSAGNVKRGLESFRAGGVEPKLLILDDGWQDYVTTDTGAEQLVSFDPNAKFPDGLKPLVSTCKTEFSIETFVVWHAMMGYWGGVSAEAFPGYGVRNLKRSFSPGILHHKPTFDEWWGGFVGLVSTEHIARFFHEFHRRLRLAGVDGVKVDVQATLEGVAAGSGGRVALMRAYREGLEGSVQTHFRGNLLNCMSCSSEMLYGALNSNVTRTSTDFWPRQPESHGRHLYTNSQVSAWFGEFVFPDWDMFQSGHPMGAFHAAGRAVGGCGIYVSDTPESHDFDLLRKLVLPDGSILRARGIGRPTRDCLFHDPTREDVLLKIFNRNLRSGVVGVFNARYTVQGTGKESGLPPLKGTISPSDVDGLEGERFAVYAHNAKSLSVIHREQRIPLELPQLQFEIFTIVALDDFIAPIGFPQMFNSGAAIIDKGFVVREARDSYQLQLRTPPANGVFLAWSQRPLVHAKLNGEHVQARYNPSTCSLEVHLSSTKPCSLVLSF
jgi:raffinose synthase